MKFNASVFLSYFGIWSLGSTGSASDVRNGAVDTRGQWTVGQSVKTSSGVVHGHRANNLTDVSEYLGIPFAQPPVGKLRFQPPVKYNGSGPINGSSFGYSCHATQSAVNLTDIDFGNMTVTPLAKEWLTSSLSPGAVESEDCLTLNVWTKPQTGDKKKAVMVWIYGGAYVAGSSNSSYTNGQFLAEKEDVVVVTMNYRLSIFGFPGNPTSRPNLGILDQRLALEWVRDNIEGFGGDPARITLLGQSAGAGSTDIHSYAWADDPIARGFIPMSGTAFGFGQWTNESANEMWFNSSDATGCGGASDDHEEVFECMMSKDADVIKKVVTDNLKTYTGTNLPLSPTIDEQIVFSNYSGRKSASAGLLIGNTDFEAGLNRVLSPGQPESLWRRTNLESFTCPAGLRAAYSARQGNPTWRYRYFGEFPNLRLTEHPSSGAWHGSDIFILFNTTPTDYLPDTPAERSIGEYLRGAWATFAKDPAKGLLTYDGGWPQYSANQSSLVRIGYRNETGPNLVVGTSYDQCPPAP